MNIEDLIKEDKTFSVSTFIAKVDNTFIMLLSSIMSGNLDRVKHKLTDELYNRYQLIIEDLNNQNKRQMYDELNVKSTEINNIIKLEDRYQVEVILVSRYMDYKIDKTTGNFIEGINNMRIEKENILIFEKRFDAKEQGIIKKCPFCGASMDVSDTGKCKYCQGIYDTSNHDWVLVDIK